ncbi:DUF4123 domain-containing protein [Achromobacter sp. ACM03]|uniref:DUF4123 domain-containing protein n=1 Tax=Achromobacter sp. ACM03 TaxID=2769300 RepID=UPI001784ACB7|nr:DUF4123 domain-containing protein [Achromobacter sp. ACM03]MBD9428801.1 DUF4123 domain-containing protein [Achromobacter sp. ACM03]
MPQPPWREGSPVAIQAEEHFAARLQQTNFPLRLYGLVDALLHAQVSATQPLFRSSSCVALFDGTPDEALAHAGPWLLDCSADRSAHIPALQRLAESELGCTWIVSGYAMDDLAEALRARLDVRMPNGTTALLRYYDARLADDIAALLTPEQRAAFFAPFQDWLVERNGKLIRIHSVHGA